MYLKTFLLSLVYVLSALPVALSQDDYKQFVKDLNIEFERNEIKRLNKAAALLNEADDVINQANASYHELTELEIQGRVSSGYEDALELLFDAAGLYQEAYDLAFSVFVARSDLFWNSMEKANHRAAGMDKAKYYDNTAGQNMKRAMIRYEQVSENDRYVYSLFILEDAIDLGKLAVRNAGRAVQICMDYPVEYDYGWDDDKSLEEIIALSRDPNVNQLPEDIFATIDPENAVDSSLFREIIFKVQIAAHTEPLSEEYLTSLYKGGLRIDLIYEESWFKYSVGRYLTFDEAEATRRECEIKKAFVVAYQDGKKIGTQEAITLLEQKRELAN